jgi:hypothetical protein
MLVLSLQPALLLSVLVWAVVSLGALPVLVGALVLSTAGVVVLLVSCRTAAVVSAGPGR